MHFTFHQVKQEAWDQINNLLAEAQPDGVLTEHEKKLIEIGINGGMGAAFGVQFNEDLSFKKGL
jgi:hypothetical protein